MAFKQKPDAKAEAEQAAVEQTEPVADAAADTAANAADEPVADPADDADAADHAAETEGASPEAAEAADDGLQEKYQSLSDQHLRLMAEYDNFRRRTKQEKDALYERSIADVVGAWLPVIDNLERALETVADAPEDDAVRTGIDMIYRQAQQVMTQFDVEVLGAAGETFDPELHEAVLHVEDDQYGDQEIVTVLQKGYRRKDRVLRHAVVQVAN